MASIEGRRPGSAGAAAAGAATQPVSSVQFRAEDLADPNLTFLNTQWQQVTNQLNALSGAAGPTKLPAGVDVAGARVTGLSATPQHPTDAVSKQHAETNYSARALAPQLEAGSNLGLKTYRALNSNAQRENYSQFLEGVLNTAPTTNTSTITSAAAGVSDVAVTVSAGSHLFVSGNQASYAERTDTLPLPSIFNITGITRAAGGLVTAGLSSAPSLLNPGSSVAVAGVTDTSFNGNFVLASVSGSTVTWEQAGGTAASSSGGTVTSGAVYYYVAAQSSPVLALAGPYEADSQQNRLAANTDGTVLIAVAVLNGSGMDLTQSAAGATIPAANNGNRILTRL